MNHKGNKVTSLLPTLVQAESLEIISKACLM